MERNANRRKVTVIYPDSTDIYSVRLSAAKIATLRDGPVTYTFKGERFIMLPGEAKAKYPNQSARFSRSK